MEEFIVNHWLKQIYGEDVPPFEVNDNSIRVLKQLFDQYKSSESGIHIILEQVEEMESDFEAETSRLMVILESLYFTSDTLPSNINNLLTSLAKLAAGLKSRNTHLSSMYLLLSNHMIYIKDSDLDDILPLANINVSIGAKISLVENEIVKLKTKTNLVRESVVMEKESMIKKQSDIIFLHRKRKEYLHSRKENENMLKESRFREEISHPNISAFRKEVSKLEAQLSEFRKRKHYYKALPLNLTLAKVRLEEAKLDLKNLNQEIMVKLNLNDQ